MSHFYNEKTAVKSRYTLFGISFIYAKIEHALRLFVSKRSVTRFIYIALLVQFYLTAIAYKMGGIMKVIFLIAQQSCV